MTAAAQDLVLQTRQRVLDHARAAAHAAFRLAATQRHASGTASCATAEEEKLKKKAESFGQGSSQRGQAWPEDRVAAYCFCALVEATRGPVRTRLQRFTPKLVAATLADALGTGNQGKVLHDIIATYS
ncbi:hypothetical protein WJX82_009652 [Trebouxia sp. C0006]